jgi:hypothetical protein
MVELDAAGEGIVRARCGDVAGTADKQNLHETLLASW